MINKLYRTGFRTHSQQSARNDHQRIAARTQSPRVDLTDLFEGFNDVKMSRTVTHPTRLQATIFNGYYRLV